MSKTKKSKVLEGFIAQQNARGIVITPELAEHYQDVKYDDLPFWKKWFVQSPREKRAETRDFLRGLGEYFKEQL